MEFYHDCRFTERGPFTLMSQALKVPITPKKFFQGKEYLHFSEQNAEKIFDFG